MNNVNITKVYLLDVPLENDYKNTLYFGSSSAQQTYFSSRVRFTFTDFSYQRKDHFIRVPRQYDDVYKCNYVMYQNSAYSNKWFYAFITDIKYVDDGRTDVYIETDVIQTWFFDYTVKSSFVEREHVSDDTIGLHTVPEGLETGEYIVDNVIDGRNFLAQTFIVGATIDLTDNNLPNINGCLSGGVYNGLKYFAFSNTNLLNTTLERVANAGKSDSIVSIFMGSSLFYNRISTQSGIDKIADSTGVFDIEWGNNVVDIPDKPTTLNGYTPKNNKLKCFPFCYLMASNNNGSNAIYKYELFSSNNCDFRYIGTLTPGMSIRLQPKFYNNQTYNNEEGLNLGKFPICSWNTDVYTNWLTQNSVNIALSVGSGLVKTIGGLGLGVTGVGSVVGGGMALSGISDIAGTLSQFYEHSLTPPQAEGNVNNGDVMFSSSNFITMYQMTIKQEYAQIIDKYFDMFGYKVNMVKVPNKNHRQNYWYTKCIDVNINGDVPQNDMRKIKDCYNKGITFWRNASNIEDYSVSNNIV